MALSFLLGLWTAWSSTLAAAKGNQGRVLGGRRREASIPAESRHRSREPGAWAEGGGVRRGPPPGAPEGTSALPTPSYQSGTYRLFVASRGRGFLCSPVFGLRASMG